MTRGENKGGSGVDTRMDWIAGSKARRGERRGGDGMTEMERKARQKGDSRRMKNAMLQQDVGGGKREP